MSLGVYNGAGSGVTRLLLHMEGNANDSSGNSNNGTSTNITYSQANGKFGRGAGFNGSSSYIALPQRPLSNYSGNFVISAWANIASLPSAEDPIYYEADAAGGPTLRLGIDNNKPHIGFYTNAWYTATGPNNVPTNQWFNIIGVKNGTTLYIYLNGQYLNSGSCPQSTNQHFGNAEVGRYRFPAGYYFTGLIDEVIIENRAWTASEVKKYYSFSRGRFGII